MTTGHFRKKTIAFNKNLHKIPSTDSNLIRKENCTMLTKLFTCGLLLPESGHCDVCMDFLKIMKPKTGICSNTILSGLLFPLCQYLCVLVPIMKSRRSQVQNLVE